MRFTTLYRNNLENTSFTDALMCICETKGDTLVLGYAYSYSNIFDDENLRERFKETINKGFEGVKDCSIFIVGCKGGYTKDEFYKFVKRVKEIIDNEEIKIVVCLCKNFNFHSKIAFKTSNKRIKMLMTGSSNLTSNTLCISDYTFFNKEQDILFWDVYELKNEESILKDIEEKILKSENNKYIDYISDNLNIDKEIINEITLKTNIISPLPVYNLKEQLKDDISSEDFSRFLLI